MTEHSPGRLPQVTLGGANYYIRSNSLEVDRNQKVWSDKVSLTGKVRRTIRTKPRKWTFIMALRSITERDALLLLVSAMTYQSYTVAFNDGIDWSGSVILKDVGALTPVQNNVAFWDVPVTVEEWL
jgi:hypothetical protein